MGWRGGNSGEEASELTCRSENGEETREPSVGPLVGQLFRVSAWVHL